MLNLTAIKLNHNAISGSVLAALLFFSLSSCVAAGSLRAQSGAIPATTTATAKECAVNTGILAGRLNIRAGQGVEYAVIGYALEGERLTITRQAGNWLNVSTSTGLTGWINQFFCMEVGK